MEEIAMQDPVLNQAMDKWEKSSDDPKIREEYYDRRKAILDEMAAVREAELRLREAIRQSEKEGREEGREEEKKKVTKKLLEKGMDFKSISDITGMSEEEIKNLR
ncbi:Rpn family recombination-promoting nuclease/putative transposase [Desulfosporosinus meridiei]|uniref:Rpn family recombination-promoting nuclease/putative transposase n=1 Tax=Desulfosporosinus meridiei TaxID=79209 RepID=UPI00249DEA45|nr:Rpn family recombination-promoting nuclease/putative transposase [Desulfosporosinus meridiei]